MLVWANMVQYYVRFPQGGVPVDQDDQFPFVVPDHFQSLLVPQSILPITFHTFHTFRNKLEPRVD